MPGSTAARAARSGRRITPRPGSNFRSRTLDPTEFILPLAGIALIVVLVWLTGGGKQFPITGVSAHEALDAEGLRSDRLTISRDGSTALAWLAERNRVALLRRMGQHTNVTVLEPWDIERLELHGDPPALTMRMKSLAQPAARLDFANETDLDTWRKALMLYGEIRKASNA